MPILNKEHWDLMVSENTDPYGRELIKIAENAFDLLDKQTSNEYKAIDLLIDAAENKKIDEYQFGLISTLVGVHHTKGEEFIEKWNEENNKKE
jgi:hypothetical protein